MTDLNPLISNGTCYYATGLRSDGLFLPCGNVALGHAACCSAGDMCLSFNDPTCPRKDDRNEYPWVGLVHCNQRKWIGCTQAESPSTITKPDDCFCPTTSISPIITAPATIESLGWLPNTPGGTIDCLAATKTFRYIDTFFTQTADVTQIQTNTFNQSSPSSSVTPSPESGVILGLTPEKIVGVVLGALFGILGLCGSCVIVYRKRKKRAKKIADSRSSEDEEYRYQGQRPAANKFPLQPLAGVDQTAGGDNTNYNDYSQNVYHNYNGNVNAEDAIRATSGEHSNKEGDPIKTPKEVHKDLVPHVLNMCNDGLLRLGQQAFQNVPGADMPSLVAEAKVETNVGSGNDTVIYNGTILTMAGGTFSPQESIAFQGDTILAVGTSDTVKQAVLDSGSNFSEHDLGDQCMMPGFIEPHLHLMLTAMIGEGSPIFEMSHEKVKTRADAVSVIQNSSQYGKPGEWIIGYGYDPSLVDQHLEFHINTPGDDDGDLDKIACSNPVYILNQSGHLAYCNTHAFTAANLGTKSTDKNYPLDDTFFEHITTPSGVKILTGVVKETAVSTMAKALPSGPIMHTAIKNLGPTLKQWAANGCTTVYDCGLGNMTGSATTDVDHISAALACGNFPRFHGALAIQSIGDVPNFLATNPPPPWNVGKVHAQGIKYWLDGSTQGFTTAVCDNYLHPPQGWCPNGTLNNNDKNFYIPPITLLIHAGWQIVLHTNGGRAVQQGIDVLEAAFRSLRNHGPNKNIMHRLEHVTADVSKSQLAKAASLNLSVTHLIAHIRTWGHAFLTYVLGNDNNRSDRIDPVADDIAAGVTYSFHSDSPVSEAKPLQYVDMAVTRMMAPPVCRPLGEGQAVTLEQAFRGVTYNPARQIGVLDEVGSLEGGKKADFVILSVDPRGVEKGGLVEGCRVVETWVGGVRVV
ncbi:amidohydrolase family-domain-containing protein [Podospora aff. communis PSN243]|uniref:Amidohydrolase family-domain-containing protein n=1 Tax=Podospora aff. communis PSN243 TaxID=3040156 RepID=A0AAV9GCQ6_9PEZI|nr:amidohydrolase family-domain-containing protein [Podospora aff. communis PSN243]